MPYKLEAHILTQFIFLMNADAVNIHQLPLGFLYELCDNSLGLWDCQGSRTCLTSNGPVSHYHGGY